MEREAGSPKSKLWLLGDSNPKRWEARLSGPFDPRHPIRHNIWTPVLDVMQGHFYREARLRLNQEKVYLRNAVGDPDLKKQALPSGWGDELTEELGGFQRLIEHHNPSLILSFGSFSYEFARRSMGLVGRTWGDWDTRALGREFIEGCVEFHQDRTNLLPLLHRSISGGRFLSSHRDFCGDDKANYFELVGKALAELLLNERDRFQVWT